MEHIISKYLAHLGIPISKNYCEKCIVSHPDYPSLLSAADTLEQLGITYQIARMEKNHLADIPFPYILHLDRHGGTFVLIKDHEDLDTNLDDDEQEDNVVIKAKSAQTITDAEHNAQYALEKLQQKLSWIAGITLAAVLVIFATQYGSWLQTLLVATASGGALVGYLLLAKDLGITYKPVETFCNAGKRTNCDRILHAKDAQLFGFFTFTDAAAGYFVFQLLATGLFVPLANEAASYVAFLAAASFLTFPVIIYSLYYQQVKAHTWCRLCLIIDGILLVQLTLFAGMVARGVLGWKDVHIVPFMILALLFVAVTNALLLIKNLLKTANTARREETIAKRVKHEPQVFAHLVQEEKMAKNLNKPGMMLGNTRAPLQVIMAANLFCNPCRIAFQTVSQLLATHPRQICFSIFLTPGMNKTVAGLSASTYIIRYWQQHIYGKNNQSELTRQLFQDWYGQMDPQAFIAVYPANGELADAATAEPETQHYDWVEQNHITATPTFFVNGYSMPENYGLKDLKALLPGLVAHINEINKEAFAVKSKRA